MVPSVDDKKYATDTRRFSDGVLQDKVFENFTDSPISKRCTMNDICVYKPGDLNKINKEGKTSWDSFSYAIQMGHNVWSHLTSVQEANRQYDIGVKPAMMSATTADKKTPRDYNGINDFRDIVDMIFSLDNKSDALELIESSQIDVKQLITHTYSISDSQKAFDHARSGDNAMKIIITK